MTVSDSGSPMVMGDGFGGGGFIWAFLIFALLMGNGGFGFGNNAAATALGGAGAATCWDYKFEVPVEEIDLTFDKPYMYIIRDKATGEVWFAGTVYNPVEK